jgi:N utilization substance protein B
MNARSNRGRVRARRCAVQALYQWQLAGHEPEQILEEFVADRELVNVDRPYFEQLTREIPRHAREIEQSLREVIDREFERIDPVERAILFIGVYELWHCPEVPWRVVINEAVDLAKMFGAEQGYKYVNATLDRLARRLRCEEFFASG